MLISWLLLVYALLLFLVMIPAALAVRYIRNGEVALLVFNGELRDVRGPGAWVLGWKPLAYWIKYHYFPKRKDIGAISLPAADGNISLNRIAFRYGIDYDPDRHDETFGNVLKAYGATDDHDPSTLIEEKAMEMLQMATRKWRVVELTEGKKFPDAKKDAEQEIARYAQTIGVKFIEIIIGDSDTPKWVEDAAAVREQATAKYSAKLQEIAGDEQEIDRLDAKYRTVSPEFREQQWRETIGETLKNLRTLVIPPEGLFGGPATWMQQLGGKPTASKKVPGKGVKP